MGKSNANITVRVVGQVLVLGKKRVSGAVDRFLYLEELLNEMDMITVTKKTEKKINKVKEGPRYALETIRPKLFVMLTSSLPKEVKLITQKVLDDKTQKFMMEFSVPPQKKFVKAIYQKFKDTKWRSNRDLLFGENDKTTEQFYADCTLVSIEYESQFNRSGSGGRSIFDFLFGWLFKSGKKKVGDQPQNLKEVIALVDEFYKKYDFVSAVEGRTTTGKIRELIKSKDRFDTFTTWYGTTENWKEFKKSAERVRETPQKLALLLACLLDIKKYLRRMKKEMRSNEKWNNSPDNKVERRLNSVLNYLDECNGYLSQMIIGLMIDACGPKGKQCDANEIKLVQNILCSGDLNEQYDSVADEEDLFDIDKKKQIAEQFPEIDSTIENS